jgi:DnaK suppressor protein
MTASNETGLSSSQRETLKQKLLDARTALAARREERLRARTGLISEVEDEADAAARAGNEDTLVLLTEAEHAQLAEIDRALAKFDSGDYGLDEETGEPIDYGRLSVVPWARFSAQTQEEHEQLDGA